MKSVFKKDRFQKARGPSKLLQIICSSCNHLICLYQKDGPGLLKRIYLDRIQDLSEFPKQLICSNCHKILGTQYIYEKENRLAYRLVLGSIAKRISHV
mgnify:CR=1 FL=1